MKINMIYDTHPDVQCEGHSFFQCRRCLDERPVGQSPMDWARQQVAIRGDGKIQVRCTRHDINIAVITPEVELDDTTLSYHPRSFDR